MDDDWPEVARGMGEDRRIRAHFLLMVRKLLDYHLLLGLAARDLGLEATSFEVIDPFAQEDVCDFGALLAADQALLCYFANEHLRIEQTL